MLNGLEAASRAAFCTLVVKVHEQRQDCLNQTENKLEPLEFVHDITPSLSERGAGYLQPAKFNISYLHKALKIEKSLSCGIICAGGDFL